MLHRVRRTIAEGCSILQPSQGSPEMDDYPTDQSRRWRPRVRLSVRVLMVLVLVLGGGFGWVVHRVRVQREAVAAISRTGGLVWYDEAFLGLTWKYLQPGPELEEMARRTPRHRLLLQPQPGSVQPRRRTPGKDGQ